MGTRVRLLLGAVIAGLLLFWWSDESTAGRGGGRGGGGFGGGGRPAPSPRPPTAGPRTGAGYGGPATGPGAANRPSNLPAYGGGIGAPQPGGSGIGSGIGNRPTTLPSSPGAGSIGNGSIAGGRGNGNIGAGRPGTGPDGPARPGNRPGVAAGIGAAGGAGIAAGAGRPGAGAGIDGGLSQVNRGIVAGNRGGTVNVSRNNLVNQGSRIRDNFNHWDCFHDNWWGRYPGCWRCAAWTTAGLVWALPTWNDYYGYVGYPQEPIYYDYGSSVVYQDDNVYMNGDQIATADQYEQQAQQYADTGRDAKVSQQDDFMPLGVFAMAQEQGSVSNNLFQLAVNKDGILRGNYYNGLNDTATPLYGSVDKKTQRAAWTVGDKKNVVYETGFANLSQNETTMLVHFGKDKTQQWTLVRMEQPKEGG